MNYIKPEAQVVIFESVPVILTSDSLPIVTMPKKNAVDDLYTE